MSVPENISSKPKANRFAWHEYAILMNEIKALINGAPESFVRYWDSIAKNWDSKSLMVLKNKIKESYIDDMKKVEKEKSGYDTVTQESQIIECNERSIKLNENYAIFVCNQPSGEIKPLFDAVPNKDRQEEVQQMGKDYLSKRYGQLTEPEEKESINEKLKVLNPHSEEHMQPR